VTKIITLRLESILQSWGERARWDTRDTSSIPTKSGVIGLLASSLGYSREDPEILTLYNKLKMAVRVDLQGVWLKDYHTVKGIFTRANGKKGGSLEPIITPRGYLQDASFLVALKGEELLMKSIENALMKPMWQIYLGRKSCVPTTPILEKSIYSFSSLEEAMVNQPLSMKAISSIHIEDNQQTTLYGEIETNDLDKVESFKRQKKIRRRDLPLGNQSRGYVWRDVWLFSVILAKKGGDDFVSYKS
jgi:CRISPR system Cascade subunit CasD